MKVVCFGASVTQQDVHKKTGVRSGYFPWLKKFIASESLDISLQRITAGSSKFNCAGYGLLPSVLNEKPDVVVLEWHTAQVRKFNPVLWQSFLSTMRDHGIHLIIAIFPKKDFFDGGTRPESYGQVEQVACEGIQVLDGYKFQGFSPEIHLRDSVHTTEAGGKFYATKLLESLKDYYNKLISGHVDLNLILPSFFIQESQRPSISNLILDSGNYIRAKQFQITYELDGSGYQDPYLLAGASIGPDAPVVDLKYAGEAFSRLSFWDSWCHFKRKKFIKIPLNSQQNSIEMVVSNDLPDYLSCRNQDFDFSDISLASKYMNIRQISIIGAKFIGVEYF